MKTQHLIAISMLSLISCTAGCSWSSSNTEHKTPDIQITIPSTAKTPIEGNQLKVAGQVVSLNTSMRLTSGSTLQDVILDKPADFFNEVSTGRISDYSGYKLIYTVPSLDTPVCTKQTKELEAAAKLFPNNQIIVISNDTPFALKRFCLTNSIANVATFSDARTREFGTTHSLLMPKYGLLARALIIVDNNNIIRYVDYSEDVTEETDILNALATLKQLNTSPITQSGENIT